MQTTGAPALGAAAPSPRGLSQIQPAQSPKPVPAEAKRLQPFLLSTENQRSAGTRSPESGEQFMGSLPRMTQAKHTYSAQQACVQPALADLPGDDLHHR